MMEKIIAALNERIHECKNSGSMFSMPKIEGCSVKEQHGVISGSILVHEIFLITLQDGRTITIDYTSRDKSRTFSNVPDRSIIRITCSDHSNESSDSWDEG